MAREADRWPIVGKIGFGECAGCFYGSFCGPRRRNEQPFNRISVTVLLIQQMPSGALTNYDA